MTFDNYLARLRARLVTGKGQTAARRESLGRPRVETLEERQLLSTAQFHFDFGTATSPVSPGYKGVSTALFDQANGYGWEENTNLLAYTSSKSDPLTRDGVQGLTSGQFAVNLPNGDYTVTARLGSPSAKRDNVAVLAEGQRVATGITTNSGSFQSTVFNLKVADGQLNLRFLDEGGANNYFSLASLDIQGALAPVASYGFETAVGSTVLDATGNGLNGTLSGATLIAGGKFGNALSFDGVNDWVTIADNPLLDFTTGMTLEAWVKPTGVSSDWTTVALKERPGGMAYALYAADDAGNPPASYVNSNGTDLKAAGTSNLPLNVWSHLATTYDGQSLKLFVNGTQVATRTVTGPITTSGGVLRLGGNSVWGEYYKGQIDEVRLYNRALTQAEIADDMNRPVEVPQNTSPPTANAGADRSSNEGASVSFAGQATGAGLTYLWDFGDGTTAAGTLTPSHVYADNGVYTARLTVSDALGRSATDSLVVTVANVNPTAQLTDDNPVDEGSAVHITFANQLDPSSADTQAGFRYSYDFNNDGTWDLIDVSSASQPFVFNDDGNFVVRGRIIDKDGGFSDYTTLVEVANVAPQGTFSNSGPAVVGDTVTFAFTNVTDPSTADTAAGFRYSYDFNNDGTFEIVNSTNSTAAQAFAAAGSYVVRGRITDKDGGVANYTTTVTVTTTGSPPPTANAGADRSSNEGASVSFAGQATGTGLTYLWNFGDGTTAAGTLTPSHVYADNGSYVATLTVTDSLGRQASDSATITVANVSPTATLSNTGPVVAGSPVTVRFSNPSDPSSTDTTAGFRYSYDFNNDGVWEISNSTNANAATTYATAGTYVAKGRIADKDGGFRDYTTSVTITTPADTTAPTVLITSPSNGTTVSGSVTVSANATDNVGVVGVQFLVNGQALGAEDTTAPYSTSWATTSVANGTHTLTARARDAAGNVATSTVTVTVNNATTGRTFYVSATGSNTGDGSATSPWQTLQHAANNAQAGDTVIIRAGNYAGFNLPRSGTAANRITFRGETGAVIDTPVNFGGVIAGINGSGKEYITIEGMTFAPKAGQSEWYAGIRLGGTPGVWVRGNIIRNNTSRMRVVGQSTTPDKYGLYASWNDGLLVEGNVVSGAYNTGIYVANSSRNYVIRANQVFDVGGNGIHNNGDLGAGGPGIIYNALIERNVIRNVGFGIGGQAISCDGVQDSRIQNNLIYDAHAKGISLYATNAAEGCKRVIVANNTVMVASDGGVPFRMNEYSSNNTIINNIFYAATASRAWVDVEESSTQGTIFDYNITTGVALVGGSRRSDWTTTYGFDRNSLVVSNFAALFVNMAGGDFHLSATSQAKDRGRANLAPTTDLDGNARPQGGAHDIGAYEFIS